MKFFSFLMAAMLFLSGCASTNNNKEIPIYTLSVGMDKASVIQNLGKPHRVVSSEIVNSVNRQVWMYQQDKLIWLSGNSFLGGRTRNDQVTYLLAFEDDRLVGWKDNQYQKNTNPENVLELRNR